MLPLLLSSLLVVECAHNGGAHVPHPVQGVPISLTSLGPIFSCLGPIAATQSCEQARGEGTTFIPCNWTSACRRLKPRAVRIPPLALHPRAGLLLSRGGEGGRGFWTQNLVYQKWPDQIFPIVNFVFSHYGHFGLGRGGGGFGGGVPPPLWFLIILKKPWP